MCLCAMVASPTVLIHVDDEVLKEPEERCADCLDASASLTSPAIAERSCASFRSVSSFYVPKLCPLLCLGLLALELHCPVRSTGSGLLELGL